MIRSIRRYSCSRRLRRLALGLICLELVLAAVLILFPATVFADDCNQDWTRAED
ncbi:MAG: hypothetical protein JSU96_01750 [Acidobacteriota bacterium]|nr:MAG: hypothetical protein JSU96_01750 [Acidobacteriota bacterium]